MTAEMAVEAAVSDRGTEGRPGGEDKDASSSSDDEFDDALEVQVEDKDTCGGGGGGLGSDRAKAEGEQKQRQESGGEQQPRQRPTQQQDVGPEAEVEAAKRQQPQEQRPQFRGPTFRTAAQAVAAGVRLRQGGNRRARLRVMPNPPLRRTADVHGTVFILYSFTVQQWQRGASTARAWRDVQELNVRYSSARCGPSRASWNRRALTPVCVRPLPCANRAFVRVCRAGDAKLRKLLPAAVVESFPEFPPARHFSDNLNDEANIKRRYEELRAYFCRVLTTPAVMRSEEALAALGLKDLYVAPVVRAKRDHSRGPRIKPHPELLDTTVPPASPNRAIKSVSRRPRLNPGIEVQDETTASSDGGSQSSGQRPPRPPVWNTATSGLGPSPMVQPLRLVDQAIEWRDQAKQWWAPVQDDPECAGGSRPAGDPDAALQLEWARPRSRSARAAESSALAPDLQSGGSGTSGRAGASSIKSAPNTPVKGREGSRVSGRGREDSESDDGWHIPNGSAAAAPSAPSGRVTPLSSRSAGSGSGSPTFGGGRSASGRSTTTDGTDGDAYVAELETELSGGAAASRAWVAAEECAAAGYGTAARRAAIFKAMAEEFPPPTSSGRLKAHLKPGKLPRVAQAEFEDLLSHPFEWVVMAYMYRMNINDLGEDVTCKVLSPTPEEMAAGEHGNEIEYDLRISIPYGVQLVAKRSELPTTERAVFDIDKRTLKTFVTMPLWTDSIGFLEYVEYRAVSPHETYFRKGIIVELAHPRFPPRERQPPLCHCATTPHTHTHYMYATLTSAPTVS